MIIDNNHIIADEGKVFKRKINGEICGKSIYLGYIYYLDGVKLDEPILEAPESFEEVDEPSKNDK